MAKMKKLVLTRANGERATLEVGALSRMEAMIPAVSNALMALGFEVNGTHFARNVIFFRQQPGEALTLTVEAL